MDSHSETPAVSVIIPNYNYAQYLESRIFSVLNQTFSDFEIILLDDRSTDRSIDVINSFKHEKRISKMEINEVNSGSPFHQWLKGIRLAKGKWIWIAEADDLCKPDFLSTCLTALKENPQAVACFVGSQFINENGSIIKGRANYWDKYSNYIKGGYKTFDGKEFAHRKLYWSNCICNTSATLFLRERALQLANSGFQNMKYAGDWLFWFQMCQLGQIIELYKPLNFFRQHQNKVTTTATRMGTGVDEDIDVVDYMEKHTNIAPYKKRLMRGLIYRKIKKTATDDATKAKLFLHLFEKLGGNRKDYNCLVRNRYLRFVLPGLPTIERDRKY